MNRLWKLILFIATSLQIGCHDSRELKAVALRSRLEAIASSSPNEEQVIILATLGVDRVRFFPLIDPQVTFRTASDRHQIVIAHGSCEDDLASTFVIRRPLESSPIISHRTFEWRHREWKEGVAIEKLPDNQQRLQRL